MWTLSNLEESQKMSAYLVNCCQNVEFSVGNIVTSIKLFYFKKVETDVQGVQQMVFPFDL